jgi:hypothetical protein
VNRLPHFLTPAAEAEAREGAAWYEGESEGFGAAFLEITDRTLAAVRENPGCFQSSTETCDAHC